MMAEKETVARPYARAIFDIAMQHNNLSEWSNMLYTAARIVEHEKVQRELANPILSAKERAAFVNSLAQNYFNSAMCHFIELLAENKRIPLLSEIVNHFERYRARSERVLQVKMTTAMELDHELQQQLINVLTKRYQCQVELEVEVDASIIGGAILYIGDQVYDGSLKGQLRRLHEQIRA